MVCALFGYVFSNEIEDTVNDVPANVGADECQQAQSESGGEAVNPVIPDDGMASIYGDSSQADNPAYNNYNPNYAQNYPGYAPYGGYQ